MANFPGQAGSIPGFYGFPDLFKIETCQEGFRLFRKAGMYEKPLDIIGSHRDLAKHIFFRMINTDAPKREYYINPFIIKVKPILAVTFVSEIELSNDVVASEFLKSLLHELSMLMNLMPFI